jgi:DNA repair photolyase
VARSTVREMACKSVINRVDGMPFAWSINPYRGCRHACVYCYARPTHEYLGLNGAEEFQEIIFAKVNAPQVVRHELSRRSWRRESVALGTATDPYQPAESRYRLTRGILEAFRDFRNPLTITTKSPMVLRDVDILCELAMHASVTVQMTVTTLDTRLWRALEPTTAKPWKRLEALKILHERGIGTGVFLSPILPGLTDDSAHLEPVVAAAAKAGVDVVWGNTLRLGPGVRDYYLDFLKREYPELVGRYEALYRGTYAASGYAERVQSRVDALRRRYGLTGERRAEKEPLIASAVQLPLFAKAG